MRILLVLILGLAMAVQAHASCVCRCVGGKMRALCSSTIDIPPLCPPMVCPLPPLSLAPLSPQRLPPLGTTQCTRQQVLNPSTHQYEWHSVCQ